MGFLVRHVFMCSVPGVPVPLFFLHGGKGRQRGLPLSCRCHSAPLWYAMERRKRRGLASVLGKSLASGLAEEGCDEGCGARRRPVGYNRRVVPGRGLSRLFLYVACGWVKEQFFPGMDAGKGHCKGLMLMVPVPYGRYG